MARRTWLMRAADDGVTHVNIYGGGHTELGRLLSNFAHTPTDIPGYGRFESIEGFWYYLRSPDDGLRSRVGFAAKKLGRTLEQSVAFAPGAFEAEIRKALWAKTTQHPRIAELLRSCTLPFDHYYVFSGREVDAGYTWVTDLWEEIRSTHQLPTTGDD